MCHQCDYVRALKSSGLGYTPNRLKVLQAVGRNSAPASAREILAALRRTSRINRVTVYRILDLLVENGLLERLSGGGRNFFYGLAPSERHPRHAHFYCRVCGRLACLSPESLPLEGVALRQALPGKIEGLQIRVDGVCRTCLRAEGTPAAGWSEPKPEL
jgi:Fur family ferric uptake transcriptional regulator